MIYYFVFFIAHKWAERISSWHCLSSSSYHLIFNKFMWYISSLLSNLSLLFVSLCVVLWHAMFITELSPLAHVMVALSLAFCCMRSVTEVNRSFSSVKKKQEKLFLTSFSMHCKFKLNKPFPQLKVLCDKFLMAIREIIGRERSESNFTLLCMCF